MATIYFVYGALNLTIWPVCFCVDLEDAKGRIAICNAQRDSLIDRLFKPGTHIPVADHEMIRKESAELMFDPLFPTHRAKVGLIEVKYAYWLVSDDPRDLGPDHLLLMRGQLFGIAPDEDRERRNNSREINEYLEMMDDVIDDG